MKDEWPPPTVAITGTNHKHPICISAFAEAVMYLTVEEAIALAADLGEAVAKIKAEEKLHGEG